MPNARSIEILLVEDNPGDVRLTQEAFKEGHIRNNLSVVKDGAAAMDFLMKSGEYKNSPTPDLILLDLNLPKKNGHEVLEEIKKDPNLKMIPVIILTSSEADKDVVRAYSLNANCYIRKPVDLDQLLKVVKAIDSFWLEIVKLPSKL